MIRGRQQRLWGRALFLAILEDQWFGIVSHTLLQILICVTRENFILKKLFWILMSCLPYMFMAVEWIIWRLRMLSEIMEFVVKSEVLEVWGTVEWKGMWISMYFIGIRCKLVLVLSALTMNGRVCLRFEIYRIWFVCIFSLDLVPVSRLSPKRYF